jgi:hypothetical protein
MATKLIVWDESTAHKELCKRLKEAKKGRQCWEDLWRACEAVVYNTSNSLFGQANPVHPGPVQDMGDDDFGDDSPDLNVNIIQRDIRYIHSQASSNPPAVAPVPFSADSEDMRKADAADKVCKYIRRHYRLDETQDQITLQAIVCGTSFGFSSFNPELGDITDYDEFTEMITTEGDLEFSQISVWDIFADPYAKSWDKVRYVFRRFCMPLEEACSLFPDKSEELKKAQQLDAEDSSFGLAQNRRPKDATPDSVVCYQYWETGLPCNGYEGRFIWCLDDGTLLTSLEKNPHRFKFVTGDTNKEGSIIPKARIPIHILTDIDVPETYYGMSVVMFSAEAQELRNQFFNASIETLRALGTPTLILPDGANVADDSITNSPWNFIKVTGNVGPYQLQGATVPPGFSEMVDRMEKAIGDQNSVNEANLGQQSREQAAALMQLASDQSNSVRRRFFGKYTRFVEEVYRDLLDCAREYWSTSRKILVMGKEKAFQVIDFDRAAITGGFDISEPYGTHFSLDPITRKDQIFQLIPLFREAGIPLRHLLMQLKLSDLQGMHDVAEMAADRQREIFEEMEAALDRGVLAQRAYIAPEEDEDHAPMLEYCKYFRSTAEFKYKKEPIKALIKQHYKERLSLLGEATAAMGGAAPEGAAPAPQDAEPAPENLGALLGGLGG